MIQTIAYPAAPTTEGRRGTLLDAAIVIDGIKWHDGLDLFETFNCMVIDQSTGICVTPNNIDILKDAEWVSGAPFTVYGGTVCNVVGQSDDHGDAFTSAWLRGEAYGVEAGLVGYRMMAPAVDPQWSDPTVTTTGALNAVEALARLEQEAAINYRGVPTIHMGADIATFLASRGLLSYDGTVYRSPLGSKIVVSGAYTGPGMIPDGGAANSRWMWATGQVVLMRGELIDVSTFDPPSNQKTLLHERPYIATFDCFSAVAEVSMTFL